MITLLMLTCVHYDDPKTFAKISDPTPGTIAIVGVPGSPVSRRPAVLAMDEHAAKQVAKYRAAGDVRGLEQMLAERAGYRPQAVRISTGDRVRVLQVTGNLVEVRVESGIESGTSGFLAASQLCEPTPQDVKAATMATRIIQIRQELQDIIKTSPGSVEAKASQEMLRALSRHLK